MSLPQKSLKAILELAASGAVGVALLLGAAPSATAAQAPADQVSDAAQSRRVSERLAAIREAVSEFSKAEAAQADGIGQRFAWHNWGNGGWRHPWGNAGWGRPWGNYGYGYRPWNNWRNGWNNWRNAWGNYR